ncbi:pseudouridine synthase [Pseudobacteroides cellulosolvens]|uniref:Pseudouridine synthase n=1 Tax=Pseudobacteroides cellulosolvens ATCC 35603 = DSM 2933 TaxID=398512 RepID=A0A0L6JH71_9FIRM|nr:pseudouridine synthase [Pseudobacteroides cellulosolvens]KNY25060.1 pseudouridine synthase Rsu [Pseudobacteroides cellulosolvens ATCC 35603 = DSM 2933]
MEHMRLQKYLAQVGIASRRKAEELIRDGAVKVNGNTVTEMGYKVSDQDVIEVNGKIVAGAQNKVYVLLNKPAGYISTAKDQFGRPSVVELISGVKERIYPVGRLDYDTSGLIILTNDGEFTYKMTHPKHEIKKVYMALIHGIPTQEEIKAFKNGLRIEDYTTSKANLKIIESEVDKSWVEITIHEGRNRQVRKMCDAIGHPVIKLKRTAIGSLTLGGLSEGHWRTLSKKEIEALNI